MHVHVRTKAHANAQPCTCTNAHTLAGPSSARGTQTRTRAPNQPPLAPSRRRPRHPLASCCGQTRPPSRVSFPGVRIRGPAWQPRKRAGTCADACACTQVYKRAKAPRALKAFANTQAHTHTVKDTCTRTCAHTHTVFPPMMCTRLLVCTAAGTPASAQKDEDLEQGSVHSWNPNETTASSPATTLAVRACTLRLALGVPLHHMRARIMRKVRGRHAPSPSNHARGACLRAAPRAGVPASHACPHQMCAKARGKHPPATTLSLMRSAHDTQPQRIASKQGD